MNAKADFPLRAFFGHHKCATAWTNTILMDVCFHMGLDIEIVHRPVYFEAYGSLPAYVQARGVDFLSYTNADYEQARDLPLYRGFHMVRDPRDVVVSGYFSHLHSHPTDDWPELEAHRHQLEKLSKKEGLLCEMEFCREEFEQMYNWDYEQEHVLEWKMEELTQDPVGSFTKTMHFLGLLNGQDRTGLAKLVRTANLRMNRLSHKGRHLLPGTWSFFPLRRVHTLPPSMLEEILQRSSFKKLSGGRKRGQENVKNHYRKGKAGDWRNHFDEDHIAHFKDTYNDVLVKLGYEKDDAWR